MAGEGSEPLVSVGMPVFNGGKLLREAIEQVVNQSYGNIEIIISDNHSFDETEAICRSFARKESRIRYYRQKRTITGMENFRFVFEKSRGPYFMWAAYDDRRSLNYVEMLLEKMTASPRASLVFSDVVRFDDHQKRMAYPVLDYPFECSPGDTYWKKIQKNIIFGSLHIYGMFRSRFVGDFYWPDIDYGGGKSLLLYFLSRGDFVRAPGACFYYYKPAIRKDLNERSKVNTLRNIRPFAEVRLCWNCAVASCYGEKCEGRYRNVMAVFLYFLYCRFYVAKPLTLAVRHLFFNPR